MKKSTKLMTLLMAMVLATGSLAACGGKGDDSSATNAPASTTAGDNAGSDDNNGTPTDVSLKVWVPQEDTLEYKGYEEGLTKHLCDEFNKAQSKWNVKVEIAPVSEGDAAEAVNKDPSKAADVMAVAGDNMISLNDKGLLSSITVQGVEDIKTNNPERAISGATFHNDAADADLLYGIPFSPNTWFMYYDKSKYSEEEVKSLETMMAKDLKDTKYNFCMPIDNGWYAPAFFFAAGCTLFGEDGKDATKCDFNNAAGKSAGKYIMDLTKNKKFFADDDNSVGLGYLKDGSLAAWCGGTWNADTVKKSLGENYAATVMPTIKIDGKDSALRPYSSYKYLVVNKSSANAEAAQDLAVWLGGEQCQKDRLAARETAPTWTSVAESDEAKNAPAVVAAMEQGLSGYEQPGIPQMTTTWDAVKAFVTWAKGKDAKEADLQKELDKMQKNILTKLK